MWNKSKSFNLQRTNIMTDNSFPSSVFHILSCFIKRIVNVRRCKHIHALIISSKCLQTTVNNASLLDSILLECWHRVREVTGSIPSQGPRHTKVVIKMAPIVPSFSSQHKKVSTRFLWRIKIGQTCNGYNPG